MRFIKKRLQNKNTLALLIFGSVVFLFFWNFFLKFQIPIPADIIIGAYFPWLNDKWGFLVGVPIRNPDMSDVVSLMYPWRLTAINYLKAGQLPLWDPTSFLGTSLIGNFQAGIFNPFNLLFFTPLPFNFAWGLQVVLQPFLAMVSMFLLLKSWRLSFLPTIFGSICYGLSAPIIVWMEYNVLGFAIAVFPLALYFLNEYLKKQNYLFLIGLSFTISFTVFAGYPQYLYYYFLFSLLFLIINLVKQKTLRFRIKILLSFSLFVLLGLLLAAIQLLPGIESLTRSIRDIDEVNLNSFLPIQNLITALVPDFFGNPTTYNYRAVGSHQSYESYAFYTSLVGVILSFFAIKHKKSRSLVVFLLISVALNFLLALDSPLNSIIQFFNLPGLKGAVTSRVLFIYAFAISGLSAIGLEYIFNQQNLNQSWLLSIKNRKRAASVASIILLVIFLLFVLLHLIPKDYLQTSLRNTLWPLLIISLTLIVIILSNKFKKIILILFLVLIMDVFRFGWKYLPFTNYSLIFPTTPIINFLSKQPKPFRIAIEHGEILPANTWSSYGLESPSGYNILLPRTTAEFISFLNHNEAGHENSRFIEIKNFNSKLLDLSNVKYVVALKRKDGKINQDGDIPKELSTTSYRKVMEEGPVELLENLNSMNRAYTVGNYKILSSPKEAYTYLSSNQLNTSNEVLLADNLQSKNISSCEIYPGYYSGQSYQIDSNCHSESILVLAEAFHPGWIATVNKKETSILKANGNFMAIILPKGQSKIEFDFLPKSFLYGAIVSLTSLGLVIFLIINKIYLTKRT